MLADFFFSFCAVVWLLLSSIALFIHTFCQHPKKRKQSKKVTQKESNERHLKAEFTHINTHTWKQPNDASNQINVFYAFNDIKQTFFTSPTLFDQTTLITLIIQFMNGILEENLNKITNESVCFRAQMHNKTHHKDLWAMSSCESQWA